MIKNRLHIHDNLKTVCVKMAEGTMGAVIVCLELVEKNALIDVDSVLGPVSTLMALDEYEIYGTAIHILHSDICGNDLRRTIAVVRSIQLGILKRETLKEACYLQDGSGKDLIPVEFLYEQVRKHLPNFSKEYDEKNRSSSPEEAN